MTLLHSKPYIPGGFRELLHVAFPLILTTISFTIMRFTDQLFISWFDKDAMAAAGTGGATAFTLLALFMGATGYVNTFVSQFHGAKHPLRITIYTWQSIYLALCCTPFVIALIYIGPVIFSIFGHSDKLMELEQLYYRILLYGGFFFVVNQALAGFFNGQERMVLTMVVNTIGCALNIGLDYLFIFGCWFIPSMGLEGAAYATVLSTIIITLIFGWLFLNKAYRRSHRTHKLFQLRKKELLRLIRFGMPAGTQWFFDMVAFTTFLLIIGSLGTVELFVTNVAFAINHLAFMPVVGLGNAVTILVGKYIGKRQIEQGVKSTHNGIKLQLGYMLVFGVLVFIFPDQLLYMFKDRNTTPAEYQEILTIGIPILKMIALYTLVDGFGIIYMSALRGGGDTRFILFAALIVGNLMFLVPLLLIVYVFHGTVNHAWYAVFSWVIFYALFFMGRFYQGKWKQIDLMGVNQSKSI